MKPFYPKPFNPFKADKNLVDRDIRFNDILSHIGGHLGSIFEGKVKTDLKSIEVPEWSIIYQFYVSNDQFENFCAVFEGRKLDKMSEKLANELILFSVLPLFYNNVLKTRIKHLMEYSKGKLSLYAAKKNVEIGKGRNAKVRIPSFVGFFGSNVDLSLLSYPQGYLVYLSFNYQGNLIEENSGAEQVRHPNELRTIIIDNIEAKNAGYMHVYVSNGSSNKGVNFDNFLVTVKKGKTRQINHYYPYGLPLSGIDQYSTEYLNKYTEKQFQTDEYADFLGLSNMKGIEMFDFGSRFYEPQLGRWMTPDPAMQFSNPYLGIANNPAMYVDPDGEFAMLLPLVVAGGIIGGAFAQARTGNDNFGQLLIGGGIGGVSAAAGFGAGSAAVSGGAGIGFFGGAVSGGAGGFVGGFTGSSLSTWYNGGSFRNGINAGLRGGAISGLSAAAIGGLTAGFSAKNKGLDFWSGEIKTEEAALEFFRNALVSNEKVLADGGVPKIDLGSKKVTEEFRKLFQYLNDNGEFGYSIDELIDLSTHFEKSMLTEYFDGFFDGGLGHTSKTLNIDFPNTSSSGQIKVGYWSDKRLISGGFSFVKSGNWHTLYLDSSTGSHMIELGLNSRGLYRHYVHTYMNMNLNKIRQ